MAPEQRAGLEYEFTVVADMDLSHNMVIGKSRCSLIADKVFRVGHTGEMAETLHRWLDSAEPMASPAQIQKMRDLIAGIEDPERQKQLRKEVRLEFGEPSTLTVASADAALAWLQDKADGK